MKPAHPNIFALTLFTITTLPVSAADQVDAETFTGWRLYHNACVSCHGVGGVGSDVAPDLTESVKRLDGNEFRLKVENRYLLEIPGQDARSEARSIVRDAFLKEIYKEEIADQTGIQMPVWKHNPIVAGNVDYIYRYLKARSTGAIGPGHPEVIKE